MRNISKNNTTVNIPVDILDLSMYISEFNYENNQSNLYECVGIVCHTGSYGGGHYFSFCKKNETWYLCNDSTYKEVKLKLDLINTCGYIFFYRRIE